MSNMHNIPVAYDPGLDRSLVEAPVQPAHRFLDKIRSAIRERRAMQKERRQALPTLLSLPSKCLQLVNAYLGPDDKTSLRATSIHMCQSLSVTGHRIAQHHSWQQHSTKFTNTYPTFSWNINSDTLLDGLLPVMLPLGPNLGSARAAERTSKRCPRRMPLCPHRSMTEKDFEDIEKSYEAVHEVTKSIETPLSCRVPSCAAWTRNLLVREKVDSGPRPCWDLHTVIRCLRVRVDVADVHDPRHLLRSDDLDARRRVALSGLDLPVCQHMKWNDEQIANDFGPADDVRVDDTRERGTWSRPGKRLGRREKLHCKLCRAPDNWPVTSFEWFCQVLPASEPGIVWFDFNVWCHRDVTWSRSRRNPLSGFDGKFHCNMDCFTTQDVLYLAACSLKDSPKKWSVWVEANSKGEFDWRIAEVVWGPRR